MSAPTSDRGPVDQLAEEFAERYRRGEHPSLTEYTERYPEWAEQIRNRFSALVPFEERSTLAGPPTGPPAEPAALAGPLPGRLGEYRLLREVGRGGMGVVYEAVQESLGRHVALKILPVQALLNPQYLERFRREARAAGRLHHSNIVPVFGVGEWRAGNVSPPVHYYAMQFIPGQGLDAVVDQVRRLRQDEPAPTPTVPVAGGAGAGSLARALLTDQFECSAHDSRPATPEGPGGPAGASPATQSGAGAVTAVSASSTDLAGRSAAQYFRGVARVGVQVAEALAYAHRQGVLHRDIKPSNLLLDTHGTVWVTDFGLAKAADGDALTGSGDILGTLRYMAPERFRGVSEARGDVYSLGVTLYELVTLRPAFADADRLRLIERVKTEEPPRPRQLDRRIPRDLETIVVKAMAKEPAARYATAQALAEDLRRFLADRPIQARPAGGAERLWRWGRRNPVVACLLAGLFVALAGGLIGVTGQWLRAEGHLAEARRQRQLAEDNFAEARRQRRLAEESFRQARQAVDQYYTLVSQSQLLRVQGLQPLRKELLQAALRYYQDFLRQRGDDPSVQTEAARTYYRMANILREIDSKAEALTAYQQAAGVFEGLRREDPDNAELQRELARTYNNLGIVQRQTGQLEAALRSYEQARALREELVRAEPNAPQYRNDLARSHHNLGNLHQQTGRLAEALRAYQQARALREELVRAEPTNWQLQSDLALTLNNLGSLLAETGQLAEAGRFLQEACALREQVYQARPTDALPKRNLAESYYNLGVLQSHTGDPAAALRSHEQARDLRQELVRANPRVSQFQGELAKSHLNIGILQRRLGRPTEALRSYLEARFLQGKLATANPSDTQVQLDLAAVYGNLGNLHAQTGPPEEAFAAYERARTILDQLVRANPTVPRYQASLAIHHRNVGSLQRQTGALDAALRSYQEAGDLQDKLLAAEPEKPEHAGERAKTWHELGQAHHQLGQRAEMLAAFQQAVAHQRRAFTRAPQVRDYRQDLSSAYADLARAQQELGQPAEAFAACRERQQLWPDNPAELRQVAGAMAACLPLVGQGQTELTAAEQAERQQYAAAAVKVLRQAVAHGYKDVEQLRTAADLEPLRSHAAFQELLAELAGKRGGP
jgi:serine/threonine-protein kinase